MRIAHRIELVVLRDRRIVSPPTSIWIRWVRIRRMQPMLISAGQRDRERRLSVAVDDGRTLSWRRTDRAAPCHPLAHLALRTLV